MWHLPTPRSIDHINVIQLLNLDIIRYSEQNPYIKWNNQIKEKIETLRNKSWEIIAENQG